MAQDKQTPPNWQKDAVPTVKGWVHPKSGELLVSTKGLLDDKIEVEDIQPEEIVIDEAVVEADISAGVEVKTIEESVVEEPKKPAKKPVRKKAAAKK